MDSMVARLADHAQSVGFPQPAFELNVQCLRARNPLLADEILVMPAGLEDPDFPGWRFEVRTARNGQPTMFALGNSSEIALHSTYDPAREAKDQVRGVTSDSKRNYFVILGMGLGYAVEALLEEIDKDSMVLIVEPFLAAFRLALETRDLSGILKDPRMVIALGPNIDRSLAEFLKRYNLAFCHGVGFIELAGRRRLPSDKFITSLIERLKGVIVTTGGNLQTLMTMAWTYQRNTMSSLKYVVDHPPVRRLFGTFKGKPAIVISAGPSLEKNIHQLAALKDRAVLIAVDTSLRPLMNAGIEPHLVCTGDPQEANWKHLRGTASRESYLVAEPMTYPLSLELFKGRLFIASYGDKIMQWMSNQIPDVGHVQCWGSVATMAFDLARKIGCDPIIFVGQDLSFPGGRTYVKGTYFEDEEKQDMSVENFEKTHVTYSLTDIYGEPVKTNRQMFAYKEWFRTEFAKTSARVVNATEGGILKENCEILRLDEAVEKYLGESFDAMEIIRAASQGFEGYDLEPLMKGLFDTIKSIKRSIELCTEGTDRLTEVLRAMEGMENLSPIWCAQVVKEMDVIRFKLRDEPAVKDFLEAANQSGVLNFQRAYKAINGTQFSRVVFGQALDLFTDLFMSMGRTARGVLPFFVMGFKSLSGRCNTGNVNMEEICLTTT